MSLAAQALCTIDITYTKPDFESFATLIITSGNNVVQTVSLTGIVPKLEVTGDASVGEAYVGARTDGVFTLSSFLGAPITVESIGLTGASSFKIASSTCVPNVALSGAKTCVIDVAFTPQAPGTFNTTLTVKSTAGTESAFLVGEGFTAPANVSPTALVFGNEALGTMSAAQRITISNPNPSAMTLPAPAPVSGPNASDFKVAGTCTSIAANASCQLMVSFSPSAAGARSAALVIGTGTTIEPNSLNTVVNSTTVRFTGTGIADIPGARVQPRQLDFGKEEVDRSTHSKRVMLTNPGASALTLPGAPSVGGKDGADFLVRGDCKTIAALGQCELSVRFHPTGTGDRSAVMSIPTGGSKATVATVDLHGFGCRIRRHDGGDEDGEPRAGRHDRFERGHRDRDRDCEERR